MIVSTEAGNKTMGRIKYTPKNAKMPHQAASIESMKRWPACVVLNPFEVW